MAVLSSLRAGVFNCRQAFVKVGRNGAQQAQNGNGAIVPVRAVQTTARRFGGGHEETMKVLPSSYMWEKFKDELHFYLFLGIIPCALVTLFVNIFIGPATLEEIPEGYRPKHWEYYRHPFQRWEARYIFQDPQKIYERNLFYIRQLHDEVYMKKLQDRAEKLMGLRGDYPMLWQQHFFYGTYHRRGREAWQDTQLYYMAQSDDNHTDD